MNNRVNINQGQLLEVEVAPRIKSARECVIEFNKVFNFPIATIPTIPTFKLRQFRALGILEEYEEMLLSIDYYSATVCKAVEMLKRALEAVPHNLGENAKLEYIADATCDIDYFIKGLDLECGIDSDAVMQAVHNSNMAKVWPDGTIHRNKIGKILKPDGWTPPDLKPIVGII